MLKTQKQFIAQSHLDPKLIRAVVRQMGGWSCFTESAPDVARHGIDVGFHGFIYYVDTCAFFRKNRAVIMDALSTLAQDLGEDMLTLIAGFGCLKNMRLTQSEIARAIYQSKGELCDQIQNALAWFAAEEVTRSFDDLNT